MKVSTKGRYALRIMTDLAENAKGEKTLIPLRDISERQGITIKYLEQIVSKLAKAGLVESSRGNSGGYRLAKAPSKYTALEILDAAEGELLPVNDDENDATREFWTGLNKLVRDYESQLTLEEIIKKGNAASRRDPSIWIL